MGRHYLFYYTHPHSDFQIRHILEYDSIPVAMHKYPRDRHLWKQISPYSTDIIRLSCLILDTYLQSSLWKDPDTCSPKLLGARGDWMTEFAQEEKQKGFKVPGS